MIYELVATTLSSSLLGDSVKQFSRGIGVFLAAMGLGARVSRAEGKAVTGFVRAQIALGPSDGFMAAALCFSLSGPARSRGRSAGGSCSPGG